MFHYTRFVIESKKTHHILVVNISHINVFKKRVILYSIMKLVFICTKAVKFWTLNLVVLIDTVKV